MFYGRPCIQSVHSDCFKGVNRYVIALRRKGTLRNMIDRIVIGMNASLPVKRHAVLYATGEYDIYYTYLYCILFIIYLIFKIKILFLFMTKEIY